MLKEILSSILSASYEEMGDRGWRTPRGKIIVLNGYSDLLIARAPVIRIHTNNDEASINALLEMDGKRRKFAHENMVSGVMKTENITDQVSVFGTHWLNQHKLKVYISSGMQTNYFLILNLDHIKI